MLQFRGRTPKTNISEASEVESRFVHSLRLNCFEISNLEWSFQNGHLVAALSVAISVKCNVAVATRHTKSQITVASNGKRQLTVFLS